MKMPQTTFPIPSSHSKPSIKHWNPFDQPREKLQQKGKKQLSDAELLAIIIGSGSKTESAVSLATRLLFAYEHNLHKLSKSSINDLCKFKGIGKAKAISILAALETGNRITAQKKCAKPAVQSSNDAYQVLHPIIGDLPHEEFWILLLNQTGRLISTKQVSIGGINKTLADARIIFKHALQANAASIILSHNHPSGSLKPSSADLRLTHRFYESALLLDINLLDHIIVTEHGFYSFADNGTLRADK